MTARKRLSTTARLNLLCEPLSSDERGQGCQLPPARLAEIEAECLRLIRLGVTQETIRQMFGASRSRVSRWCQAAIARAGDQTDFRLVNAPKSTGPQRLWARIDVRGADECWNWLGATRPNGYGTPPVRDDDITAHRAIFRLLIAEIPDGMVVDHKCCNPRCCNPRHLQLARQNENLYFVKVRNAS